ncbi:hypothetical protein PCC7424_2943 [Gloeothece citriformis PCC 7424]|uniref:Uncharacterized protein n=1 Tax=Gloeothece citriformis (strain PCC 7424) TaxID=65393 RepID=B7K9Z1_GLOC7|nr:hypothetical protein [Gloeothece citriformis]ACK71347.1 hypothetical protein PCC7424_2943 [Gloeothece citriformis PCC 7424]
MKLKLGFFGLSLLLSFLPLSVNACPNGNPQALAYIRRDNNRCEGLLQETITRAFELVSFSTQNLSSNYPNTLKIRVPTSNRILPNITLESPYRNYYLSQLQPSFTPKGYTFDLNTYVLKQAKIPPQTLLSTAFIEEDSKRVFLPVILGQASDQYVFIIYSPQPMKIPKFEIRRNGKTVYSNPRNIPQRNYISFTWKYGQAPAGQYELYLENDQKKSTRFYFNHYPNLLK